MARGRRRVYFGGMSASLALVPDASPPFDAAGLARAMTPLGLGERLALARAAIDGRIVLTTGFGIEGQALVHAVASAGLAIELVTIDTGRLFAETHELWAATEARYGVTIRALAPEADAIGALVREHGANGFRRSVEARVACCDTRKVAPMARALAGAAGWVTGLRGGQSRERAATPLAAWDAARGVVKLSPLADWPGAALRDYLVEHGVPVSALHHRGFPSVGCAPCTRAIEPGEDARAGRWWWEQDGKKECGLHMRPLREAA